MHVMRSEGNVVVVLTESTAEQLTSLLGSVQFEDYHPLENLFDELVGNGVRDLGDRLVVSPREDDERPFNVKFQND